MDVAPIGPDYLPGHAHADTLTFELSLGRNRVIVDSGTSCYGGGLERRRQRSTAAHNTVAIDGCDSSEVWGGFRVARRARPFGLEIRENDSETLVACSHDGYRRLHGKPVHRREWGATLIFFMGLTDDVSPLSPMVKLGVQVVAALVAYAGGVGIFQLPHPWHPDGALGWLSLPATVFWFLLVINAINLIDGLDGLAAGVSLFVSLILLVLSLIGDNFLVATGLAAIAGACLGFLRYNFNPASIKRPPDIPQPPNRDE